MIAEVVFLVDRWILKVCGIIVAAEYTSCYEPEIPGLWRKHTLEQVAARINETATIEDEADKRYLAMRATHEERLADIRARTRR